MFMFQAAKCRGCGQVLCCSTHRKQHERICMSFMSKFIFHASKSPHPNLSSGVYSGECSSHLKEERDKLVDQSHNKRKRHHVQSSSPYPHSSENSSSSVSVPHNRKYKKAVRGKFRKIQKLPTLESVKEEDEEGEGGGDDDPSIQDNGLCVNKLPNRDAYIEFIVGSLKDSPITLIPSVSLKNDNDSVVTPSAFSVIYNDNEKFKTSTPDSFPILGDPPITTPLSKQGYKLPHSVMALKASTPKEKEEEVRVGVVGQVGGVELNQGIDAGLTPTAKIQPLLCTPAASQPPEQQGYFTCQSSSDQNEKGILVTPLMSSGTRNYCNEISTPPVDGEASNTQHSNQLNKPNETKHSSVGMVYDCGSVELKQGIDRGPTQSTPEIDAGLTPVTKVQPLLCTPAASQPPELQGFFTCQSSSDWNEKGILVTPVMSSETRNDCNEISTPPVDSKASKTQYSNQLNLSNDSKQSPFGMLYGSGSVELKPGIDTCAQRPKPQRFSISRSSSGSTASSVYYSSGSVISPLALNSHPCTPVTNPSLFTSIKDVFRTFISHLPGQRGDVNVDGVAPINSLSVNSPARKRIKMADLTRIKCRPTFKRRYKKPASYVFKR